MRRLPFLLGVFFLASCQTPMPERAGAPERPAEEPEALAECAVLVPIEAADTSQGLARQEAWLAENFPGARIMNVTTIDCAGTPADRVVFVQEGVERVVVFDASSFFGKVDGDDLDELLDG